jgi:hypothetical protein
MPLANAGRGRAEQRPCRGPVCFHRRACAAASHRSGRGRRAAVARPVPLGGGALPAADPSRKNDTRCLFPRPPVPTRGTPRPRTFVYAVSLLAALEGATGHEGHAVVLPFLGMARAELTDFGQRRNTYYVDVEVDELRSCLAGLEERLTALLVTSEALQQTLRVDAALAYVRRGIRAAQPSRTTEV